MGIFIEDVQGMSSHLGLVIRQWNECVLVPGYEVVDTFGEKF